jgi:hypothetical protein
MLSISRVGAMGAHESWGLPTRAEKAAAQKPRLISAREVYARGQGKSALDKLVGEGV